MKKLLFVSIILLLFFTVWLLPDEHYNYPAPFHYLAQVFQETTTPETLQATYQAGKISVLLVPGHDNEFYGTKFGQLREADVNLAIARHLYDYLAADGHFTVSTARDFQTGD